MGFIDSSSSIVVAILTTDGRNALAKNDGSFRISKFSFGDDEINYSLYNPITDDDTDILNLPILEPSSNAKTALKYRLITLPKGSLSIGFLVALPNELILTSKGGVAGISSPRQGAISVQTVEGFDYNGYIATSRDPNIASVVISNIQNSPADNGQTGGIILVRAVATEGTTFIDIIGKDTGSSISIPVTVSFSI
jgi:hypothetical protein